MRDRATVWTLCNRSLTWAALVVVAAVVLTALPAAGDWLVTREDGRVETRGSWEVQGRLVVFHLADGTLSSLRLDQVNLEASGEATRRAEAAAEARRQGPPPAAAAEPVAPRRRITTEDVGRGTYRPPVAEDGADSEAAGGEEPAATAGASSAATELVVLTSQEEETYDGHVRISGSLANQGDLPSLGVRLTVFLQDTEGEMAASSEAQLDSRGLMPGEVATFRADFPEVFAYTAVAFRASGTRMATGAEPASADEGEAENPGAETFELSTDDDDLYDPASDGL